MNHLVQNINPDAVERWNGRAEVLPDIGEDLPGAERLPDLDPAPAGIAAASGPVEPGPDGEMPPWADMPDDAVITVGDEPVRVTVRPVVGARVLYIARRGSMRGGRTEFPADVLRIRDDGTLDLHIVMDREDYVVEERVSQRSPAIDGHCWDRLDDASPPQPGLGLVDLHRDVEQLRHDSDARADSLRAEFDALAIKIFGSFQEPPKALMEYLADFDARLAAIEAAAKPKKAKKPA